MQPSAGEISTNKTPRTRLGLDMRNATQDLPTRGYAIIIDGCVKSEFETRDGVERGARDLKRRFPALQVEIYDAQARDGRQASAL
jgi:hypothetical protein